MENNKDLMVITVQKYKSLLKDSLVLAALESGGVDNWDYYGDSVRGFLGVENAEDFDELVERDMNKRMTSFNVK